MGCALGHLRENCHSCPDGPCQRSMPAGQPAAVAAPEQPAAKPRILATRRFAAVAAVLVAAAQLLIGKVV